MCSIAPPSPGSSSAPGSACRSIPPTNARVFDVALDGDDLAPIETALAKSRDLMRVIGDCGDEYR
jgi:hypothetical protein